MTRINCMPVETLSDKHLLAEYKEITRPFSKVEARIANDTMTNLKIPEHYVLGTGHETFFFDKLHYLYLRYQDLCEELIHRGVNIDMTKFNDICNWVVTTFEDTAYWNYWVPRPEDMYLNMARLVKRSNFEVAKSEALSEN
ncbi:DenV endonuclease V [Vibrio phage nt-1]|uniref:DenV endonuclease V n=1 Tax=Vibrio phage nt-1 TaxID=115992 RepID=R9TFK5_9CAUD|nr:endonuclease V N-glycosylase UV repair enzyme [Vibrio phage nt-1]AGN30264.1 DenV endonuclease V [Vibrio phage nt-1]